MHRRRRIPLIWLVPVVTGLIALWLAWDTYSKRGPTITVSFEAAAGLTAGQSQLKFKDVTMGTVKSIAVAPDLTKVLVTIETTHEAAPPGHHIGSSASINTAAVFARLQLPIFFHAGSMPWRVSS